MKKKNYLWILVPAFCVMSCETFLEGMGQGLQGFNSYQSVGSPGGYQVMPGGFVRDTSKDYLLDPRYAMQQVLQQEQQEYQAAKRYRPNLTLEQYRLEKGQALQMINDSGNGSTSSSRSRSSNSSTNSSGRMCGLCAGSGKCKTCEGKGYYYSSFDLSKKLLCPNCNNHNGLCSSCGGTGKR